MCSPVHSLGKQKKMGNISLGEATSWIGPVSLNTDVKVLKPSSSLTKNVIVVRDIFIDNNSTRLIIPGLFP